MYDGAVRLRHAVQLVGLEALRQAIEACGHPRDNQIRRDTMIAVRHGFDCHESCRLGIWRVRDTIHAFFLATLHSHKNILNI